tara:strand:+ start:305 stop:1354 length:1050 start_codon:yes stop_codon:yes gene_type:complete
VQLYNKLSAKERERLIDAAESKRLTLSFYKYTKIFNPKLFRDFLFINSSELDVLGRIYIAHEGINAQMSIPSERFFAFKDFLNSITFLEKIRLNIAIEQDDKSFLKLTIKVKEKIVADGLNDNHFDVTKKGVHLNAIEFNDLLSKPNTLCVDMRNHYESEIGRFKGAITPDVDTFRESLSLIENQLSNYKTNKQIVMYCTGGIRCEKASAYLKHKGFKNVFQLEGGIIEYSRQVKELRIQNLFRGKNFVFDERKGERISDDIISNCHQCGKVSDLHVNCANESCHLLFIQCNACKLKMKNCCSKECMGIIELSIEEQKALRKGKLNSNKIFKKGRSNNLKFKITPPTFI